MFTHCFSHSTVDYLFSRVVRVDCTTQSAGNKADLSRGSADCGAEVLSADLTPLASYYTNQLFRHDRAHRDGARVSRWQNTADPPTWPLLPSAHCWTSRFGPLINFDCLRMRKNCQGESARVRNPGDESTRVWRHWNVEVKPVEDLIRCLTSSL